MDQSKRKKNTSWCVERTQLHHSRDPRCVLLTLQLKLSMISLHINFLLSYFKNAVPFQLSDVCMLCCVCSRILLNIGAVFYVVSKKSNFYGKFKAGLWAPPSWAGCECHDTAWLALFDYGRQDTAWLGSFDHGKTRERSSHVETSTTQKGHCIYRIITLVRCVDLAFKACTKIF